jgi:putative glycerol kinase 5
MPRTLTKLVQRKTSLLHFTVTLVDKRCHVAALDVGSSSVRCFVVDKDGNVAGSSRASLDVIVPGPGLEEIDPDHVWDQSVLVVREAIASQ